MTCRRHGFHPWVEKIPQRRAWQSVQYSCLGNPMDRGTWQVTDHGVTKRQTRLKWVSTHITWEVWAISHAMGGSQVPMQPQRLPEAVLRQWKKGGWDGRCQSQHHSPGRQKGLESSLPLLNQWTCQSQGPHLDYYVNDKSSIIKALLVSHVKKHPP